MEMNCPHPTSFSVCVYLCVVGEYIPHPLRLISFGWGKFTGAITIQLVSAGTDCGLSDRQNRHSSPEGLSEAACFYSGEGIWWRNLLLFGLYLQQMPSPEKIHDGKMTTSPAIFSYIGQFFGEKNLNSSPFLFGIRSACCGNSSSSKLTASAFGSSIADISWARFLECFRTGVCDTPDASWLGRWGMTSVPSSTLLFMTCTTSTWFPWVSLWWQLETLDWQSQMAI